MTLMNINRPDIHRITLGLLFIGGILLPPENAFTGESSDPLSSRPASEFPITVELLDQLDEFPGNLMRFPPPIPRTNPQSPEKIELGKMLFFDPRLSGSGHWACATCHNPSFAFTDPAISKYWTSP